MYSEAVTRATALEIGSGFAQTTGIPMKSMALMMMRDSDAFTSNNVGRGP